MYVWNEYVLVSEPVLLCLPATSPSTSAFDQANSCTAQCRWSGFSWWICKQYDNESSWADILGKHMKIHNGEKSTAQSHWIGFSWQMCCEPISILNCRYVHPIRINLFMIDIPPSVYCSFPWHLLAYRASLQCTVDTNAHIASVCRGALQCNIVMGGPESPLGVQIQIQMHRCTWQRGHIFSALQCNIVMWGPESPLGFELPSNSAGLLIVGSLRMDFFAVQSLIHCTGAM